MAPNLGEYLLLAALHGRLAGMGPGVVQSDTSTERTPPMSPSPKLVHGRCQNCRCEIDVSDHAESM